MDYDAFMSSMDELWNIAGTAVFEPYNIPPPLNAARVNEAMYDRAKALGREILTFLLDPGTLVDGVEMDVAAEQVVALMRGLGEPLSDAELAAADKGGVLLEHLLKAALDRAAPREASAMLAEFAHSSGDHGLPVSSDTLKRLVQKISSTDAARLVELAAAGKLPEHFIALLLAHGPDDVRYRLALAGTNAYVPGCDTQGLLLTVLDAAEPFLRQRDRDDPETPWWFTTAVRPNHADELKRTAEECLRLKRTVPVAFLTELIRLESALQTRPTPVSSAILRCLLAGLAFRGGHLVSASAFYKEAIKDGACRSSEWARTFSECCTHIDGFRSWVDADFAGIEPKQRLLRIVLREQPDWVLLDPDAGEILDHDDAAVTLGLTKESEFDKAMMNLPRALVAYGEARPARFHPSYDTEEVSVAVDPETGRGVAEMSGRGDTNRWQVEGRDPIAIARAILDERPYDDSDMTWRTKVRGDRPRAAKRAASSAKPTAGANRSRITRRAGSSPSRADKASAAPRRR